MYSNALPKECRRFTGVRNPWLIGQIQPTTSLVNKALLECRHAHSSCIISGHFHSKIAEFSSSNKDYIKDKHLLSTLSEKKFTDLCSKATGGGKQSYLS